MYGNDVPVTDLVNKMFDSVERKGDTIVFKNAEEEYRLEQSGLL